MLNMDHSPPKKRARFEETYNNEVSKRSPSWTPLLSEDVFLNDIYEHGIGRLDCVTDVCEEDSIFRKNEEVDVSCSSMTPDSRRKQVSVLQSSLTQESLDKLSIAEFEKLCENRPLIRPTSRINYFELLSDEVILNIFRWLPKTGLREIALCCRKFNRLTYDESLWTRMDLANKHLKAGDLGIILSRQVIVLRLARSEILYRPILSGCQAADPEFCSRLMYLDLSMASISPGSLVILFNKCRRLKKLSLENVPINNEVLMALSANTDIEVINFAMCTGIRENGLKYFLNKCKRIRELNIGWTFLNSASIQCLCEHLPSTMDRLNLSGCCKLMTDNYISKLVTSCPNLRELDLSDSTILSGESIKHITKLDNLTFIALSRCYLIPYKSLVLLTKLAKLSYLDIHGGFIKAEELKEIQTRLGSGVQFNQFKFSSIARPTVGMRRNSIWNMRVMD